MVLSSSFARKKYQIWRKKKKHLFSNVMLEQEWKLI